MRLNLNCCGFWGFLYLGILFNLLKVFGIVYFYDSGYIVMIYIGFLCLVIFGDDLSWVNKEVCLVGLRVF